MNSRIGMYPEYTYHVVYREYNPHRLNKIINETRSL
jgi:hypothetical protein